jgi:hypothetical protein
MLAIYSLIQSTLNNSTKKRQNELCHTKIKCEQYARYLPYNTEHRG